MVINMSNHSRAETNFLFGQLSNRESLCDVGVALETHHIKRYHLGMGRNLLLKRHLLQPTRTGFVASLKILHSL